MPIVTHCLASAGLDKSSLHCIEIFSSNNFPVLPWSLKFNKDEKKK